MRIRGKLTFKSDGANEPVNIIVRSLAPDNVSEIRTVIDQDSATVTFSADKVGTMLSSVDDFLMNATIVEKLSHLFPRFSPVNASKPVIISSSSTVMES